jgi:hypothetical protein
MNAPVTSYLGRHTYHARADCPAADPGHTRTASLMGTTTGGYVLDVWHRVEPCPVCRPEVPPPSPSGERAYLAAADEYLLPQGWAPVHRRAECAGPGAREVRIEGDTVDGHRVVRCGRCG